MVQTTQGPSFFTSPIDFTSSLQRTPVDLSSSLLEPGSADSEIVRRNLITDFLSATSIPVNVPLHRYKEAVQPNTPMRLEFGRCNKHISQSLANKLFPSRCETQEKKKMNTTLDNLNVRQYDPMIFHIEI